MSIKKIQSLIENKNIANDLDDTELARIGKIVKDGYTTDENSRSEWSERMEDAMDMAMQNAEQKSFPWPNASNVIYPMITVGSIQFWARAYGAIIQGNKIVKAEVFGRDDSGEKRKRGERLAEHTNYQLTEEMPEWQTDTSQLLMEIPVMGLAYKKTFYSPIEKRPVSKLVHAKDLVINYDTPDMKRARKTEVIFLYENQVIERENAGIFREDVKIGKPPGAGSDEDAPHEFLEQHNVYLDLDDDGYKEPYIVTVHRESNQVMRIVARFDEDTVELSMGNMFLSLEEYNGLIADRGGVEPDDSKKMKLFRIRPVSYYTKYGFIPSPDGSHYDMGFGTLLKPINESVNTAINQMNDAGTLQNLSTGLIGRGLKVKKGIRELTMGELNQVEASGEDIRKQVYMLDFKGPSPVLFQLLGLMIDSGTDIVSVKDIMLGDLPPGETPATTTLAAIEQGMQLFSGIYKAIHFSQKEELRKIYRLNRKYLEPGRYHQIVDDPSVQDKKTTDYQTGDDTDYSPITDPTIVSPTQRLLKAQSLLQFNGDPLHDQMEIRRRYHEATGQENIDSLLVKEPPEPPPDPKMIKEQINAEVKKAELIIKMDESKAKTVQMITQSILNLANAEAAEFGPQLDMYAGILDGIKVELEQEKLSQGAASESNNTGTV